MLNEQYRAVEIKQKQPDYFSSRINMWGELRQQLQSANNILDEALSDKKFQGTVQRDIRHWWTRFKKRVESPGKQAIPYITRGPSMVRCSWKNCLCGDMHPLHCMRICTGCWVVRYCGKQCQTQYAAMM